MSRKLSTPSVFAVVFFFVARSFAVDLVEGSDPRAKPIKEALAALVKQIVAGDLEKAKELYAGTGADLELLKAYVADVEAAKAMRAAVGSKFGDRAGKDLPEFDRKVAGMAVNDFNSVIFMDADRASSSADSPLGVGIEFKRVDGTWKVLSLASRPNTPQQHLARLRTYLTAVHTITEKIKSGRYASADAVNSEVVAAEDQLWPIGADSATEKR